MKNYRPIPLISNFSKIFEKIKKSDQPVLERRKK